MDKFYDAGREKKCRIRSNRKGRIPRINLISVLALRIFIGVLLIHNLLISIGNIF